MIIITIGKILAVTVPVLISVAYFTLLERKVMAGIQRRRGPSNVGVLGLLQPFADGLKLFVKENLMPVKANKYIYIVSPMLFLGVGLANWGIIPLGIKTVIADVHLGVLYVLALSSMSVYGLIIGGWASNSQYAFLGALRSAAQMISYEIAIALILFTVVIYAQTLNLSKMVLAQSYQGWYIYALFPVCVMFFICALAETARPPFDLPEAESESVSGYNVEYSSMGFAFFFIAEYTNIISMSFLCTILFLGGWLPPMNIYILYMLPPVFWVSLKVLVVIFIFIWIRAAFPRFRFDQLMSLTWRVFLPVSFSFFVCVLGISLYHSNVYINSIAGFFPWFLFYTGEPDIARIMMPL